MGSAKELKAGSFPNFPESILLARLGVGKALACFQVENWETVGSTSTRKDMMACRAINVVGSQLEFGAEELILSHDKPDDLAMADFEEDKAIVCYSDKGTNNYCRILTVQAGKLLAGNTVDLGQ